MRVKQFYKKTGRKLEFNGKEQVGFDKNKVECFNCHRRGHFVRDYKSPRNSGNMSRDAWNARYKGRDNGKRPAKEEDEQALLDEALKEKEDSKAKLEKFETFSKNLTKLLDSQISAKVKTTLRYDSQFNKKEVLDIKEEEVSETVFDNRPSDEENSVANDRFKKVFTRSGRIPVSAAKPKAAASISAAKPINTTRPKQSVKFSKTRRNKAYLSDYQEIHDGGFVAFSSSRVNSVKQIHTIVDEKVVVISESSVRSDLFFNDKDGKFTPLFDSMLVQNQAPEGEDIKADEHVHQEGGDSVERDITIDASLVAVIDQVPRNHIGGIDAQTRFETTSKKSSDPPLSTGHTIRSEEETMEQETDLTDLVPPTPHDSPLSGGHTPGSNEGRPNLLELMNICTKLSNKVLALEKAKTTQDKVITRLKLRVKRLEKKRKARTSQPMKRRLFKGRVNASNDKSLEVIVEDKGSGEKGGSTADQVSTARLEVSAATPSTPPTTTTTIFGDEDLTIAQTLIKMKSEKAKKRKLDRAQNERQKQEETIIVALTEEFDEIQAKMDVDHELVIRMTHKEQEMYTIKDMARLLAEYIKSRKKQLAVERAEAIRNKPPTRTQVRNLMITYLKHMDDFVPMDFEKEEKKSVEPESKDQKGKRIKIVADSAPKQKSSKKQKMMQEPKSAKCDEEESADYEQENEELRMWLTFVLDEEETVDLEFLSTKYPIVDWESQILGNVDMEDKHVYKIIKANENTSYYRSLSSMLRKFDR
nr:ribonuclease H-like domain-containing protein [Tanacetum cinerariifolium]